ncbi:hypothetical protein N0V94_002590 [Neodidymelliopsis sp. IMI 364377]|nr:hypothetical protein N0V94_002590 [Neodidymelliopsis sp. IMI 364377]
MMDPTLVSPPDGTSISPVSRTTAFSPKTSSAVATHAPFINTSVPAINAQPVELDGVPTSPQEQETKRREMSGSKVHSSAEDEDIDAEFLSEGGKGAGQLGNEQKRAAMLATRSKDASVIVDVPREPTAEEVEAADSTGRKGIEANTPSA